MSKGSQYARFRNGSWYVGESRVELCSVVAAWQQGFSPEEVRDGFPHLTLKEIYGAILFYLEHQEEMDAFFRQVDQESLHDREQREKANPEFYAMMRERVAHRRATRHQTAAS